jgi:hypothetical protein
MNVKAERLRTTRGIWQLGDSRAEGSASGGPSQRESFRGNMSNQKWIISARNTGCIYLPVIIGLFGRITTVDSYISHNHEVVSERPRLKECAADGTQPCRPKGSHR